MAFPRLLSIRANEITPEDIQAVLAHMIKRGCTRQTNIVRSYLRAAFAHVGQRHDFDPRRLANEGKIFRLQGNPVDLVPRIQEYERMGKRVLMRQDQRRWSSERPHGMPEFIRKGAVGDWMNHISGDQARRLVEKLSQRTRGTGADELWPDIVEVARHWA